MKLQMKAIALALASSTLLVGTAWGEARVGIQPAGGPSAIATARVNVTVSVPKFVYLRVGAFGAGPESLAFGVTAASILPYAVGANNQIVASGTIPTPAFATPGSSALTVQAYTNNGSGASLACTSNTGVGSNTLIAAVANEPKLTDITITAAGASVPAHPGGGDATCTVGNTLTALTTYSGTWTYGLTTPSTPWLAGSYGVQIAYTATTL